MIVSLLGYTPSSSASAHLRLVASLWRLPSRAVRSLFDGQDHCRLLSVIRFCCRRVSAHFGGEPVKSRFGGGEPADTPSQPGLSSCSFAPFRVRLCLSMANRSRIAPGLLSTVLLLSLISLAAGHEVSGLGAFGTVHRAN